MNQGQPYFSIVVTARNDDHGGNLLGRMQAFVNGWIAQAKRHNLSSELIVVEWNPPAERPFLEEAIQWPADSGPCSVRIIKVPAELHHRYAHAEALPLYQMIAKNVGIRRAHGRFVLATNIDIIFSDELVAFLSAGKLEPWRMYRIDRHDAMADVPLDGIDEQLEYCRNHLIRINVREGTLPVTPDGRRTLSPIDIAPADSGITFNCGWFTVEKASATEYYRWADNDAEIHFQPAVTETRSLELEVEPGPGVRKMPLRMRFADQTGDSFAQVEINSRCVLTIVLPTGATFLQCSIENGGRGISGDPRTLNFRAFQCVWTKPRVIPPVEEPLAAELDEPTGTIPEGSGDTIVEKPLPVELDEAPVETVAPIEATHVEMETPPAEIETHDAKAGSPHVEVRVPSVKIENIQIERPGVTVSKRRSRSFIYWQRFQQLIALLAERDTVHVPLQAGPRLKQALQVYVQSGGITGMLFGRRPNEKQPEPLPPTTPNESTPPSEPLPPVAAVEPTPSLEPLPPVAPDEPAPPSEPLPPTTPVEPTPSPEPLPPVAPLEPQPPIEPVALVPPVEPISPAFLHTNACGDFTLMAREHWHDLRGYPEFDLFSMNLDSVFCFAAHHAGVVEETLRDPMRIYHIEHGSGSGWTPEGQARLFARVAQKGLSFLDYREVMDWAMEMRRLQAPMIFNLGHWGLAEFDLPETLIEPGSRASSH